MNKRNIGASYERIVESYLDSLGYKLISRNVYLGNISEIDLILRSPSPSKALVFGEVRFLENELRYFPDSKILSSGKRKRLVLGAKIWMKKKGYKEFHDPWRIDLVVIRKNFREKKPAHYKSIKFGKETYHIAHYQSIL